MVTKKIVTKGITTTLISAIGLLPIQSFADSEGKLYADFRLRFENVSQENALEDADALTLRSRIGYKTPTKNGFSGLIEVENSTALIDDYSFPPVGLNPGQFSIVADPDSHTEIDQAFVRYQYDKSPSVKLGRQVLTLDNHRFVGHVGWRQDRQTFDAFSVDFAPTEKTTIKYAYLDKRNRIFADERDIDAKDHLFNASYKFASGKLTTYAYLLEVDDGTDNSLDTFGISYSGKGAGLFYRAEYASQDANDTFDADYLSFELGKKFAGVTAKIGYEKLGSDDGNFGFSTPLATLHKFNGWADQFLGTPDQGLEDVYILLTGKVAGGKWLAAYHDFSSDVTQAGTDDLGSEINLLYAKKFGKHYSAGIKYASYDAGNAVFNKVDTDKLWLWVGAKF